MLVTARKDGRPKKEVIEKNLKKPSPNLKETQQKPSQNLNYDYDYNYNLDLDIDIEKKTKKETEIKYADYVKMKENEYNKLVDQYGKSFTDKCISILDNYKGANGKKYKSDYRAILNWVVDRCKKEGNKVEEKSILNDLYEN